MTGSCEHGNKCSGSIKGSEFVDQLSILLSAQEGLHSIKLVHSQVVIIPVSYSGDPRFNSQHRSQLSLLMEVFFIVRSPFRC
jgi:hypothetical protein